MFQPTKMFVLAFMCDPAWANRFGALIVIVGVVFAFSDIPDALLVSGEKWQKARAEFMFRAIVESMEDERHESLSNAELKELRRKFDAITGGDYELDAKQAKHRFLFVGVVIVCVGTFMHGLGDWLVGAIKQASCWT